MNEIQFNWERDHRPVVQKKIKDIYQEISDEQNQKNFIMIED